MVKITNVLTKASKCLFAVAGVPQARLIQAPMAETVSYFVRLQVVNQEPVSCRTTKNDRKLSEASCSLLPISLFSLPELNIILKFKMYTYH
jgi:hypothetical protein